MLTSVRRQRAGGPAPGRAHDDSSGRDDPTRDHGGAVAVSSSATQPQQIWQCVYGRVTASGQDINRVALARVVLRCILITSPRFSHPVGTPNGFAPLRPIKTHETKTAITGRLCAQLGVRRSLANPNQPS